MHRLPGLLLLPLLAAPAPLQAQQPIIIDHNSTDLSKIPANWIESAKQLKLHYGFTSHGSQIISGIGALQTADPTYKWAGFTAPLSNLPPASAGLRIFEGQTDGNTYITPELYWADSGGISLTNQAAASGLFGFSMWAWCGQQSSNSVDTVNAYLGQMSAFEAAHPGMRFILMTGHTDGGSSTLIRNNNLVRAYAQAHNMVLFDFNDIESYDPAGNYYVNDGDGMCTWCASWCSAHPADCTNLPGDCAHSHPFACKQKAKAFWWMMARLAGWDGTPAGSGDFSLTPAPGSQSVTAGGSTGYTVSVTASGGFSGNVTLSATGLPAGASATFTPNPAAAGASSLLTVSTGVSTPVGSVPFTIGGASGALNRSASATLVVNAPQYTLATAANPASRGNVSPASGGSYVAGSTVNVQATPNTGYVFTNWTGPVAASTSASTTVTMTGNLSIAANFAPAPTTLGGGMGDRSGPIQSRQWTLQVRNDGTGFAETARIESLILTQTSGAACSPVVLSTFPVAVGDLAPGASLNGAVTINFTGCPTMARFSAVAAFSANAGAAGGAMQRYNLFR